MYPYSYYFYHNPEQAAEQNIPASIRKELSDISSKLQGLESQLRHGISDRLEVRLVHVNQSVYDKIFHLT